MKRLLILALALFLSASGPVLAEPPAPNPPEPVPAPAAPPGPESETGKALEEAKDHLEKALKALGEAGRKAFEENSPAVKQKAGEVMQEMQRQLRVWEEKLFEQRRETPRQYRPYPPYPQPQPYAPQPPAQPTPPQQPQQGPRFI